MDKYSHLIAYIQEQPWALHPRTLAHVVDVLRFRSEGGRLTKEEVQARIESASETTAELVAQQARAEGMGRERGVAVIPIFGIIAQHAYMVEGISGPRGTATENISRDLRMGVENPDVTAIVFNVHSPGGGVYGVAELASDIRAARKRKPVVAVANSEMASAAYWIGSATREISVTPGGRVGSIGVWAAHQDISKMCEMEGLKVTLLSAGRLKVAGNPFEPLSEEARELIQKEVSAYYSLFTSDVAKGRGVAIDEVRNGFGEGAMVMAKDAVGEKMADRVETLEEAILRVAKETAAARGGARAEEVETPASTADADEEVVAASDDEEAELAARLRLASI